MRAGGVSHVYSTKQTAQLQRETVASCALKRKRVKKTTLTLQQQQTRLSLSLSLSFQYKGQHVVVEGGREVAQERERDMEWESTKIISDAGARQLTEIKLRSRDRLSLTLYLPLSLSLPLQYTGDCAALRAPTVTATA